MSGSMLGTFDAKLSFVLFIFGFTTGSIGLADVDIVLAIILKITGISSFCAGLFVNRKQIHVEIKKVFHKTPKQ